MAISPNLCNHPLSCSLTLTSSSRLKLNHPIPNTLVTFVLSLRRFVLLPIRPLLIQHTISALFTSDGISFLQSHFGIAVAAEVLDWFARVFETVAGDCEAAVVGIGVAAAGAAGEGGWGVLFAGHRRGS